MKIIRVVKSQVVILHTVVLTILMFSSMVGYVAGSIYCEEGVSLLFWKWYTVLIALIHDAQQACSCHSTVLILVCRKTCTVTAYWYTCTYNMLYSVSYVTQKRDDRLWVSVKFSPPHFNISITRARFLQSVQITECGCHDDGGSMKCSNACALIAVHLTSTSWKQQPSQSPQWLLQIFQRHACKVYDFLHLFFTVLYFQQHEFHLLSWWVHIELYVNKIKVSVIIWNRK